jgi:hypothetical protein
MFANVPVSVAGRPFEMSLAIRAMLSNMQELRALRIGESLPLKSLSLKRDADLKLFLPRLHSEIDLGRAVLVKRVSA